MKEQLIQYVNLLFAGVPDNEDMKQEILQNTLDRYDDLISQGKSPQAAYHLAITGIGDISELISSDAPIAPQSQVKQAISEEFESIHNRILKVVAIALYILSPIPLFILGTVGDDSTSVIGLCITLVIVAIATAMLLLRKKNTPEAPTEEEPDPTPKQKLRKSIDSLTTAITLAVYLIVSFATKAWAITWLIFPISACVDGLINAILDLKEANKDEN